MFVLKPAHIDDLDQLLALADVMAPGITTFPPNKAVIREKIAKSQAAFALSIDDVSTPRDFLLVLHDTSTSRVIGTTAIYSHIGAEYPFYSFKRVTEVHMTQLPDRDEVIKVESTSLQLVHDFHGGTEVGTLLLHPDYKGYGLGKMLAKSRYLFFKDIAQ